VIDERFILHRYKATSHAAVVGTLFLVAFLMGGILRHQGFRSDLMTVLVAMAVTMVAAMAYFRFKD
jgi:positive regulator of sigma E activity